MVLSFVALVTGLGLVGIAFAFFGRRYNSIWRILQDQEDHAGLRQPRQRDYNSFGGDCSEPASPPFPSSVPRGYGIEIVD